jgi:hypothetical protein
MIKEVLESGLVLGDALAASSRPPIVALVRSNDRTLDSGGGASRSVVGRDRPGYRHSIHEREFS